MSCASPCTEYCFCVSVTLRWGLECLGLEQDSDDGVPVEPMLFRSAFQTAQCILCGRERWATAWGWGTWGWEGRGHSLGGPTWGWEGRGQGNSGLSGTRFLTLSPEPVLSRMDRLRCKLASDHKGLPEDDMLRPSRWHLLPLTVEVRTCVCLTNSRCNLT